MSTETVPKSSLFVWWVTIVILFLSVLLGLFVFYLSKTHQFKADSGPAFIDVSSYPAEMQKKYHIFVNTYTKFEFRFISIFVNKCSRCHTLARPINSGFTAEQWPSYVQKMKLKTGSGLTDKTANQITDFLIFDANNRKSTSNN